MASSALMSRFDDTLILQVEDGENRAHKPLSDCASGSGAAQ